MEIPVVDLHCDLLYYLQKDSRRTAYDSASRCSLSQLQQGGVQLQTMAIFTLTGPNSVEEGNRQASIFKELPVQYPSDLRHYANDWSSQSSSKALLLAYENASGFCSEDEPLKLGLKRLFTVSDTIVKPLYVSLTWNQENRFGGGSATNIGLKPDGQQLLLALQEKQIALDLSHASDALAIECLDFIEAKGLNIALMASHSNARTIKNKPRNLSDEIAREIFRRQGVVGLNLYPHLVGDGEYALVKQVAHWLELGGESHMGLGADFFCEVDIPVHLLQATPFFFEGYQNASCYRRLFALLQKELRLSEKHLKNLAHQNALDFIDRLA